MKIGNLLSIAALMLIAGGAYAGLNQPAPIVVDLVNMSALGDQVTARTASDDVTFIGCGIRVFDNGVNSFSFGFCQAGDSDENQITCFTENPTLLDAMKNNSTMGFISFSWQDDGGGGAECTRVGFSTQSFYLPNFTTKGSN
jgi:hypothetical protein